MRSNDRIIMLLFISLLIALSLTACSLIDQQPPTPTLNNTGNADVLFVRARQDPDGSWTFFVTVSHPDKGWEDYADGWDVVLPDGTVVKPDPGSTFTRTLLHPHEDEQPFTRSQSSIELPDDVKYVTVRAHDLVDGYGGQQVILDLSQETGENYEIERMN
jgi:hypothetical protein